MPPSGDHPCLHEVITSSSRANSPIPFLCFWNSRTSASVIPKNLALRKASNCSCVRRLISATRCRMSIGLTGELREDIYVRHLRDVDASRADNANTSCAVAYRFPSDKKARTIKCGQRRTQLPDYAAFFSIEVGQPEEC